MSVTTCDPAFRERVIQAGVAVFRRYPPRRRPTLADRARWHRVRLCCAALDAGHLNVALRELRALERLVEDR